MKLNAHHTLDNSYEFSFDRLMERVEYWLYNIHCRNKTDEMKVKEVDGNQQQKEKGKDYLP